MSLSVRIGLLRLADSAPAILAEAEGLFAAAGLDVALHIEPSWANVADKLAWGLLDAAVMLPPLALAMAGGLRGPAVPLRVPMGLSEGGNSVVVAPRIAAALAGAADLGAALAGWVRAQPQPPRLAVVHVFSTHNLLLRHFLATTGLDPDRDVDIVVVPPGRVVAALADGQIAGFCAGAPWGDAAALAGAGQVLLGSADIRPHHAEKCLAVTQSWADRGALTPLCAVLRQAQRSCEAAAPVAALVDRLGLPEPATRAALTGPQRPRFAPQSGAAAEARWLLAEMNRWGWLPAGFDAMALVDSVYAPP